MQIEEGSAAAICFQNVGNVVELLIKRPEGFEKQKNLSFFACAILATRGLFVHNFVLSGLHPPQLPHQKAVLLCNDTETKEKHSES